MAHEVFAGSRVQLTAQPISHTLEGRGVFHMGDGGNVEGQNTTRHNRPSGEARLSGTPGGVESRSKPAYAWPIDRPVEDTIFRLQARTTFVDNPQLTSDITELTTRIRVKPPTEWEIDEFKEEFNKWDEKEYQKEGKDDLQAREARVEVHNLLVEAVLQQGMDVTQLIPDVSPEREASAEKQEEARRAYEVLDREVGRTSLTTYDRLVRERMIKRGLPPIAGGAHLDPHTNPAMQSLTNHIYTDELVKWLADRAIDANSTAPGMLDDYLLNELVEEAQGLASNAAVDKTQLIQLRQDLDALRQDDEIKREAKEHRKLHGVQQEDAYFRQHYGEFSGDFRLLHRKFRSATQAGNFASFTGDWGKYFVEKMRDTLDEENLYTPDVEEFLFNPTNTAQSIESRLGNAATDNDRREIARELYGFIANKYVDSLNPAESISSRQLELFADDKTATEKFVIRIISSPLQKENTPYLLGFYEGINLSLLTQMLDRKVVHERAGSRGFGEAKDFARRINFLVEGIRLMHDMNYHITSDNLDNFVNAARSITSEHIQTMNEVPGVGTCFRIIEEEYLSMLARDKMITSVPNDYRNHGHGNYEEMFGYSDKSGVWHEGTISKIFRTTTEMRSLANTMAAEGDQFHLERWQQDWGGPIAQYLYNLFLRAPEMIAQGEFPKYGASFARAPLHTASNLMDWVSDVLQRYEIGETGGGQKFIELSLEEYDRQRTEFGWDHSVMGKVQGLEVAKLEHSGVLGVVGYFRSWRQELALFKPAPFFEPGTDNVLEEGMYTYINDSLNVWDDAHKIKQEHILGESRTQRLGRLFFADPNTPAPELRPEFNNSLGILLRQGFITPSEKDLKNFDRDHENMKLKIRAAIWRRTAELNPLAMVSYLQEAQVLSDKPVRNVHGVLEPEKSPWQKFLKGKTPAERARLETRRTRLIAEGFDGALVFNIENRPDWNEQTNAQGNVVSIGLKRKLIIANEMRLATILEAHTSRNSGAIRDLDWIVQNRLTGDFALTNGERVLLGEIEDKGKIIAEELATIRLPFNPFMNDIVYETANYEAPGEASYKDALGGDTPAFFRADNEFIKLVGNPAGLKEAKEAIAVLAAVSEYLGDPLGKSDGQDRVAPFLIGFLRFVQRGGILRERGHPKQAFLDEWTLKNWIKQKMQLSSSWAQRFGTNSSLSLDVYEIEHAIKDAQKDNVLRKLEYEDPREDYKGIPEWTRDWVLNSGVIKSLRRVPGLNRILPDAHHDHGPIKLTDSFKKMKAEFGVLYWNDKFKHFLLNVLLSIFVPALALQSFKEGGKGEL